MSASFTFAKRKRAHVNCQGNKFTTLKSIFFGISYGNTDNIRQNKKKVDVEKVFAPSVCFPKVITCMGVTVTCANATPGLLPPNITVPPLSSKRNICKCLTLLLQKDENPHDHKEKVMKTRGRRENTEPTGFKAAAQKSGEKLQTRLCF